MGRNEMDVAFLTLVGDEELWMKEWSVLVDIRRIDHNCY